MTCYVYIPALNAAGSFSQDQLMFDIHEEEIEMELNRPAAHGYNKPVLVDSTQFHYLMDRRAILAREGQRNEQSHPTHIGKQLTTSLNKQS